MAVIGLISMSDGRPFVRDETDAFVESLEQGLATRLEALGHSVVRADRPVSSNTDAVAAARQVAAARPDLTIFHYSVWAFPNFSALAAAETTGPLLLFSNIDPQYPGMVGMLAAGGSLDQMGRGHARLWGDVSDDALIARMLVEVRAGAAVRRLRGQTFGRLGGRSMGMYTAVANPETWISKLGIDVEEIDQWEIVRRAGLQDAARVRAGREWLERHAAAIHYDAKSLTPELLERQIRAYHAIRELIDEYHLDFTGIKGQPELTNNFCTTDIAEAFLNDPYDWEGPKDPHVCATEVDMDGALTMQILKSLSGTPALFADVRHYWADRDVWDLCNSGQHATWFAARSDDPAENLRLTNFYPENFYFPAGGASVQHYAAPGRFTFARLSRLDGRYRIQVSLGDIERYDDETNERLGRASTFEWPHAFAKLDAPADAFLSRFGANHIHAVPGEWTAELQSVARLLDIEYDELSLA